MAVDFVTRDSCPVCRHVVTTEIFKQPFSYLEIAQFLERFYQRRIPLARLESGNYSLQQCLNCNFLYQSEVLNDEGMRQLYENWVDNSKSLEKKKNAPAKTYRQYARVLNMVMTLFKRKPSSVAILEFGIGWGYWSQMAKSFGFDVDGLELSRPRVEHAQSLGVNVIDQLNPDSRQYDFIFANQVFEHLSDPLPLLVELRANLTSNGFIYLRVPDGRGVAKNIQRNGWSPDYDAIHPLEHINCFDRESLIRLGAEAGLVPAQPPLHISLPNIIASIKREITDRYLTTHILFKISK